MCRAAQGQRNRDGQRKMVREFGEPLVFGLDMSGITMRTGQAYAHLRAEMEGSIVVPALRDGFNGKVGPTGELVGH